jgi:hypothetical protein
MEKQENLEKTYETSVLDQKLLELIKCQIAEQFLNQKPKHLEAQLNYDTSNPERFGKAGGGKTLDQILQNYDNLETYYLAKFNEWLSTMEIARKYFTFANKKEMTYRPDEFRYYCFTCEKKLRRKQVRSHKFRNHLVVKLTEPKPRAIQDQQKFQKSIETKSFLEPFNIPRCYYCGKFEKDDFPLTEKTLGYMVNEKGEIESIRVKVCPLCYYQRFGKRPLSGNSKNPIIKEKISKFLWIQRNYVLSLKKVDPDTLNQITDRIRRHVKQIIQEKLEKFKMKLEQSRDPEYEKKLDLFQEKLEKEFRDRLSKALILC